MRIVSLLGLALLATGTASAQAPGAPPPGSPIPRMSPAPPPSTSAPAAPVVPEPGAAPVPDAEVAVRDVIFVGATAFPQAELAARTTGLVGPRVKLAAIAAARQAVLDLYREHGFVFVQVDAVVEADDLLRIVVIEGHVVEVKLDGDIGPAGTQVLRFLNNLIGDGPLNVADLERWLLLAQDVPGVAVRSVLRPASGDPGALTLVAQVTRRSWNASLLADNRSYRLTGPDQMLASLAFNSFTEFGERTELQYYISNADTQHFAQASLESFIGGSGLKIRLYAGQGSSHPSGTLEQIGYAGDNKLLGAQLSYPLIRQRSETLVLSGIFDATQSEVTLVGLDETPTRTAFDSLRVLRAGIDWARQDLLAGDARPAVNAVSIRLSQGFEGLGSGRNDNREPVRAGSRVDFRKIAADVSRVQTLFSPWPDATLALQGVVAGQWSDDILPSSEKFYLGGPRLGRGFYAGEITGDIAFFGSLELQLSQTFILDALGDALSLATQSYLFLDSGRTWEQDPDDRARRIASVGVGVRTTWDDRVSFDLEAVKRLTRRPLGEAQEGGALKEYALFWRIYLRY